MRRFGGSQRLTAGRECNQMRGIVRNVTHTIAEKGITAINPSLRIRPNKSTGHLFAKLK